MNAFIDPSKTLTSEKNDRPVAMTYEESSGLTEKRTKNVFPVSYQSISGDTTCAERMDEDDGMLIYHQTTDNTSGRRVCILLLTVVMSIIMLSSVLLPLFTYSRPKLDPLVTGFVGPLSLSMVHRDATTSYYEVLDNSYDVINGQPVKRVLVTHSPSLLLTHI